MSLAVAAAGLALAPSGASAVTFLVDNTHDSGADSLRQAITDANGLSGPDRIDITATGIINLQSELPHLSSPINITGPGFGKLSIRRDSGTHPGLVYSVLTINAGKTVRVSGVTIANGAGTSGRGGGIDNAGALTLVNDVVSHNSVSSAPAQGGGIYNVGVLSLFHTAVAANTAGNATSPGFGGGIENDATLGGSISLNAGSLISQNRALGSGGGGGGLAITGGTINIFNSTLAHNFTNAFGGAIYASGGFTSLIRSMVADNKTNGEFGGGISMQSGAHVTLARSTMSGNIATSPGGTGVGGAIDASDGVLDISNSTIAANRGSGAANIRTGAATTLDSSILGDPLGGGEDCGLINSGTIASSGHNVTSDTSCIFAPEPSDHTGDPKLKPLAYNGGPTFTVALKSSSPAIGAGDPTTCGTKDQRLLPIANDGDAGGCDAGAFEFYARPHNDRRPEVKGKPKPGHQLKCSKGKWSGGTPIAYAYQWYRGHRKITGEAAKGYDVRRHDAGHSLRCKVTATNAGGKAKRKSKGVKVH